MNNSISIKEEEYLKSIIEDWSMSHGLIMRAMSSQFLNEVKMTDRLATIPVTIPVTIFPTPFPRFCFNLAKDIQIQFNKLYASISQDEEFLQNIVEDIIDVDSFIANLWSVHLKVKNEGYVQNLSLGLFRSDYLIHTQANDEEPIIKQVEFNTIASSFGGLSSLTSELHRYLAQNAYAHIQNHPTIKLSDLPENNSTNGLARGLQIAVNCYIKTSQPEFNPCVIFLVLSFESNVFDQCHLEYAFKELEPSIPVFRLPLTEVLDHTKVRDTPKRELLYYLPCCPSKIFEVTVVYFRAGYAPSHYSFSFSWNTRLHIERSNAIKCPSILTQLAGIKKVQQVLAAPTSDNPSILSRFLPANDPALLSLEETFTAIYPLDESPAGIEAQRLATDPDLCRGYVLKPQREGGGNNIYRSAIPKFLKSIPKTQWKCFILMKIILTPKAQNLLLRNGTINRAEVICELGVYGTCLWNQATKEILDNEQAGYLLRTKSSQSEEGGVTVGYGYMDSCYLS